MPTMIRKNGRAKEIAYSLIGKPENLRQRPIDAYKRGPDFYRNAKYSNVFTSYMGGGVRN